MKPFQISFALCYLASILGARAAVTLTNLYSFSGPDGATPSATLVEGSNGVFYGTCKYGGTAFTGGATGYGTIFRLTTTPTNSFTVLYSFNSTNDGRNPDSAMLVVGDGTLYGTTRGNGRFFKMTQSGNLTVLGTLAFGAPSGIVKGGDGNFYGTTVFGYGDFTDGTVFQMTPSGSRTIVGGFTNTNGSAPYGSLVLGRDGCFYGTTTYGGDKFVAGTYPNNYIVSYGVVFKADTNGTITVLGKFDGSYANAQNGANNGANPKAPLCLGSDGNLYGTCTAGGTNGKGTIFKVTPNGSLRTLYSFPGFKEANPQGNIIQASDGNYYGTTQGDGSPGAFGAVYQFTSSGQVNMIWEFEGWTDGFEPVGGLIQGQDGRFYGTASGGGTNGYGTIFRLTVPLQPVLKHQRTNGVTALTWTSVSGLNYQLQYKTNTNQTTWTDFGSVITATNGTTTVMDMVSDLERYYRVVLLQ